jgi:diaminopimelate decarboxylase
LRPAIDPSVAAFLNDKAQLGQLVTALGSPLNLLFPGLLKQNIDAYQAVLTKHSLPGRVFFAHKVTMADCLIRQLAVEPVSLDVASLNELRHGLSAGFTGDRMEATGPKNAEFLSLCMLQGVTINVDSVAELAQLVRLKKLLPPGKKTKLLLRLSGFASSTAQNLVKSSRFGVPLAEVDSAFRILQEHEQDFSLLGFAFHLDTVTVHERLTAIEQCLDLHEKAVALGFEPNVLNIGGGFRVNYLENQQDWANYVSALKESVLGTGAPLTWQKSGFGMSVDNGKLKGSFNTYGYFEPTPGAKFLDEILNSQLTAREDKTVATIMRSNMIELWIEPGRSLVDQCGVTVARVNSLRKASTGEQLVSLNMKRQDVAFLDQEFFVDPVVLYRSPPAGDAPSAVPVFFAGDLCLESDLICRHLTFLKRLPEEGDLVAFINTAGYYMDFSASQAIMQPVARKVAIVKQEAKFSWVADEQFSVAWHFYNGESDGTQPNGNLS